MPHSAREAREEDSRGPLFSIQGLYKSFPADDGRGEKRVLDNINLDIHEGERLLIAGSNGSGKTLLMRILAGLLDPSGGEISFRGKPLRSAGRALRGLLGLVFQDADAQILGETVEEDAAFGPRNLGFPREKIAVEVERALRSVGLWDKRNALTRRLSGGEKRRLAVAGVIAMGCETVIMDEPFANLDWPGVLQVLTIIRDLKEMGKTLIILTHELEKILALTDRLVILHRGLIREDGAPEEILPRLLPEYGVRNPLGIFSRIEDLSWL